MTSGVGIALAERGFVPLPLLRRGIRGLCRERLVSLGRRPTGDFFGTIASERIAESPDAANAQHYEVPAAFFSLVLGRHLKYSGAWWPDGTNGLDDAERRMLELTCERAGIEDGQEILELGCGWGSLSLHLARRYPNARITAVSNSASQREFILAQGAPNLRVITADMNRFAIDQRFDRIVSVEMFEHMRDWPQLLTRADEWLKDDGRMFIHVFCHARHAYTYETAGTSNWMGRHFFTGGIMPSYDLMAEVRSPLTVARRWWMDGTHYQRTAEAWRLNLEGRRDDVMRVLREHYGGKAAATWYQRWRLFFLACEELFGYAGGTEWGVGHYLLSRKSP